MNYRDCYLHSATTCNYTGQYHRLLSQPYISYGVDLSKLISRRIESIDKYGILSLNKQKELFSEAFRSCPTALNGDNYICLSDPNFYNINSDLDPLDCDPDEDDLNIFNNKFYSMSFIISRDIDNYLEFRQQPYRKMNYEVQVKEQIPREYILGLRVPSLYASIGCNDEEYIVAHKYVYQKNIFPLWDENIAYLQQITDIPLIASYSLEEIPKVKVLK